MRTDTPPPVKLSDYAPYPFEIDTVTLRFDLTPDATLVEAVMQVRRTGSEAAPMRLDGEMLTLKDISIDNRALDESAYTIGDNFLEIGETPDAFTLRTVVEIAPSKNTALSGLYMSAGRFCSQCESEGFRRITYWPDRPDVMAKFSVRMAADKAAYPILLSNGTPGETGDLSDGRHFAEWDDPHPKPSYLFALCAGAYDIYEDTFETASGRKVDLAIHVDKGEADKAAWAMDCLKRSMTWDEEVFDREYDLGVFNIVAVRDFNFGAMENKGLNIFNSAYVLADEATATDFDFEAIESIVAHEYFHNWTGNRITCRDWFQLCLKEGLTVFRDQEFSADMRSRPVQRIKDVIRLHARQFAEDAGPLAHPVRPDSYASIDNLYTATVYEKGAELIRALKTMIGPEAFKAGMDIYFERHDGDAATIEDFYACFETATGKDLSDFRVWYAQAGTPAVGLRETWDETSATLTVSLKQVTPATPGQDEKRPVPIPLACALLDGEGGHMEAEGWPGGEKLIVLEEAEASIEVRLPAGSPRPMLSVNRGYSAPVTIRRETEDLLSFARAETDPYNRWEAINKATGMDILRLSEDPSEEPQSELLEALASATKAASKTDPAFAALLLRLPLASDLMMKRAPADPTALEEARRTVKTALAARLADWTSAIVDAPAPAPFRPDAEQAGIRALRAAASDLLSYTADGAPRLKALFDGATNMTESLATLRALCNMPDAMERAVAVEAFYAQWRTNQLVIDKWFGVLAGTGSVADVEKLMAHADFDMRNPNRVRSVIGVFSVQNMTGFHHKSGEGHALLAKAAREADKLNPALAARLLTAFEQWKRLEPVARESAEKTLQNLKEAALSKNASDIVARALD
ncbi:MAG: aminopeptidase N [Pseudomonadota bacterium]